MLERGVGGGVDIIRIIYHTLASIVVRNGGAVFHLGIDLTSHAGW